MAFKLKPWIPLEENEQETVFAWAAMWQTRYPALKFLVSSMNGILTDARFGAKLKRLGRKAGFPDIFLPVPCDGFHGLFIELKRREGGTPSRAQLEWIEALGAYGYQTNIAFGANNAIAIIKRYLGIENG